MTQLTTQGLVLPYVSYTPEQHAFLMQLDSGPLSEANLKRRAELWPEEGSLSGALVHPMQLPSLRSLVTPGNSVRFTHYRKGDLWYEVMGPGLSRGGRSITTQSEVDEANKPFFSFPVPVADCGDASFLAHDKALLFMRYIRKHLADLQEELKRAQQPVGEGTVRGLAPGQAEAAAEDAVRGVVASARSQQLSREGYK